MARPEDTGSRTEADAAAFERWASADDYDDDVPSARDLADAERPAPPMTAEDLARPTCPRCGVRFFDDEILELHRTGGCCRGAIDRWSA